jgi:hypothetical protein
VSVAAEEAPECSHPREQEHHRSYSHANAALDRHAEEIAGSSQGSEPAVTLLRPPAGWPYGVASSGVGDESIAARIERLVAEEHELRSREQIDSPDADALQADRERLRAVEVELNRCWDLLRQRRAREEFGLDPDDASARGADTIEEYEQ